MMQDNPLSKLFVNGLELDLQLLADTIEPFIKIYTGTDKPEIRLTALGNKLVARDKLLVYLLARKATVLSKLNDREGATPTEIEQDTGIPGGTVRPTLKKLADDHLIRNDEGYTVPNNRLLEVSQILKKGSQT